MSAAALSTQRREELANRDPSSAAVGIVAAIIVHVIVASFVLRAGAHEGNVVRALQAPAQAPEEEIIEGALLRLGGGGNFDPRTIHREVPIRTEENAREAEGLGPQQPNQPPPQRNLPTRRDPNALLSNRDVMGRGNQDLAERLARLEQLEQAGGPTIPGAPPGPGHPDGSVNGTETDPNRAGHGAQAKIRSFLQRQLHLLATAPPAARSRPFRLSITISSDGSYLASGRITDGSGDETVDSDLSLQLAQLAENRTPIPELTDEEKAAIAGHRYAVRYQPD